MKKYWAFVGRVPEGENLFWATGKPTTQKTAFKQFRKFVANEEGLTEKGLFELGRSYGTAIIIDGMFSSESEIRTHGESGLL